jgi:hypothetical protein
MITGETAEGMRGMLAGGHSRLVQGLLRRIIPHGYDPKQVSMATEAGALDRDTKKAQDELKAMAEKERTSASIQKDIADTNERIRYEKASIAEYEKTGKLSQAQKLMLAREENDLAHDQVQLEKDIAQAKRDQADAQRATKEWQDWSNRAARDFMQGKIHAAMEEIRFPTIADMAGRNFTQRLGQQYGAGGRFDLGRGNGPLGDLARQYELAEKQQLYDRTYGNNAMAEKDRQNMISARARLVESGVQDPAVIIGKIGDDTGAMRKLFDALVQSGLIVKSN